MLGSLSCGHTLIIMPKLKYTGNNSSVILLFENSQKKNKIVVQKKQQKNPQLIVKRHGRRSPPIAEALGPLGAKGLNLREERPCPLCYMQVCPITSCGAGTAESNFLPSGRWALIQLIMEVITAAWSPGTREEGWEARAGLSCPAVPQRAGLGTPPTVSLDSEVAHINVLQEKVKGPNLRTVKTTVTPGSPRLGVWGV